MTDMLGFEVDDDLGALEFDEDLECLEENYLEAAQQEIYNKMVFTLREYPSFCLGV
jgi:hypothetical protein